MPGIAPSWRDFISIYLFLITAIPHEFEKNGWKIDENLPHGRP
jgi:hypothetical protein